MSEEGAMQHIDQKGLAERWLISPRTLEQWRWQGPGATLSEKICRRVVYPLVEIEAFEAAISTRTLSDRSTVRTINEISSGIRETTIALTVLPPEAAEGGKGGKGGDFQITNAEFIAAVFLHLPKALLPRYARRAATPVWADGAANRPIKCQQVSVYG